MPRGFGALYGWRWLYACWFRLRRRCLRPRLSRCCWSCPPAAGYGAGRGNTGSRRAPGPGCGDGESVASVPQASDRNTEPEIKEAFGTAQAAPREPAAGVPSAQEEGRTEASGASRKTPVLRSGEILLPAPARLAGFVWLAGVGVCALWHLCALCGMARPHVPLEPADGKLLRREGLRRGLPGGAYASRTGDICQCRRAVPYGRGRAASGGAGPGGPV